jgi:PAS domain S-box-containing protein
MLSLVSPHLQFVVSLPDPALIVNRSGEIVLANQQAQTLFGYQSGELIGQPVQVLVPEAARHLHPGHIERYFADPHVRQMGSGLKLFGRRRDGSEFAVDVALSPLREDDALFVLALIWVVGTNQAQPTAPLDSP